MAKLIVAALVAGFLVAGAHAQEIANVQVGADGRTSVQAPFTNVNVDPKKAVKVDAAGTSVKTVSSSTAVNVPGKTVDVKKDAGVKVDVQAGGVVKVDVKKAPESSTTTTASKTQKTGATASATAATTKPAAGPAKTADVNVNVDKTKTAGAAVKVATDGNTKPEKTVAVNVVAPGTTVTVATPAKTAAAVKVGSDDKMKPEKTKAVAVDVKAPGTSVTTTTVTAPVKAATTTTVTAPATAVKVDGSAGGQPTTAVNAAGIAVKNSPMGTTVDNIPFVGSVSAPGGRRMLRT